MQHIKSKYIQLVLISGFLLLGFLSSCSHNPEDFDPSFLQEIPFSGEEDEEEIILPDTFNMRTVHTAS